MDRKMISETENFVREKMAGDSTGHDWWHVDRVRKTSLIFAGKENADLFIVEMAALLHDVADHKFIKKGDENERIIENWLKSLGLNQKIANEITEIIENLSYKGAGVDTPMRTIEGKVVQDADRLDAIGAIGIARTFAYGGYKGNPIHVPGAKPTYHDSFETYKKGSASTINHFYEKLLLLKERMNTESGKKEAIIRHERMIKFLEDFFHEWNGEF